MQKVIAEINLKSVKDNASAFINLTKKKLCAVVKANAYGHGAVEIVSALCDVASCFAVALIEEAVEIKTAACGADILVFTPPTNEEEAAFCIENGFILSISNAYGAALLNTVTNRLKKPAFVHLKLNTGMNRYGAERGEIDEICALLKKSPYARVKGVYSHLYTTDERICREQRSAFLDGVTACKRWFPGAEAHLAATYGATLGEEFSFDMARVGIGLYGYLPRGAKSVLSLKKAMKVFAKPVYQRRYERGGVGYGDGTELPKLFGKTLTAYRFGYADGFLRKKENGLDGWERNVNCLCMDVCLRQDDGDIGTYVPIMTDADKTAAVSGTISYEVLCAATARAEMVYVYE